MGVKLKSDFNEVYDHWFDNDGDIIFERNSRSGMSRPEMLKQLEEWDFRVPFYGNPKDVALKYQKNLGYIVSGFNSSSKLADFLVVLHHDIDSHRGENKEIMFVSEAIAKYPNTFCTVFIPFPQNKIPQKSESYRFLKIGKRNFWLKYHSSNDWRSNCGDVYIEFISEADAYFNKVLKSPLYAIDFVSWDTYYAVDFNIAPGIPDILLNNISPKEIAANIKEAVIHFREEEEHG